MVRNMPVFIQLVITTHNHVTIAQLSAAGVSWCWRTSLSLSLAYICALQKEVPYHGRLYITDSNLCFFSSVLLKDTKVRKPRSSLSLRTSGAAGLTAHPCVAGGPSRLQRELPEEAEHRAARAQRHLCADGRRGEGQFLSGALNNDSLIQLMFD